MVHPQQKPRRNQSCDPSKLHYGNLRYKHGFQKLAHETIRSGEDFLDFVRHIEQEVQPQWSRSELRLAKLRSDLKFQRSQSEILHKRTTLMKQILSDEAEKRKMYEARVAELDEVSDDLRRILARDHGDMPLSDDERQRQRIQSLPRQTDHSPRKRERMSENDRWRSASANLSSGDGLVRTARLHRNGRPTKREGVLRNAELIMDQTDSRNRPEVVRDATKSEGKEAVSIGEGTGDMEIIITTNVTIPENGPVKATSSLTTIPVKRVSFVEESAGKINHSSDRPFGEPDGQLENQDDTVFENSESDSLRDHPNDFFFSSEEHSPDPMSRDIWDYSPKRPLAVPHHFGEKFFLKPDICTACRQTMPFGQTEKACVVCRAACHSKCVRSAQGPCQASGSGKVIFDQNGHEVGHYEAVAPREPRQTGRQARFSTQPVRMSRSVPLPHRHETDDGKGYESPHSVMEGGSGISSKKPKSFMRKMFFCMNPR